MNIDFPALPTAITAVLVAVITYLLTQRREHKSEWRKIKFAQYQEYLRALSGIVEGRSTAEAQDRYSDAANGMLLGSSLPVMRDLNNYLSHNSYSNKNDWSRSEHDRLLNLLIKVMRKDMNPGWRGDTGNFRFNLISVPPR